MDAQTHAEAWCVGMQQEVMKKSRAMGNEERERQRKTRDKRTTKARERKGQQEKAEDKQEKGVPAQLLLAKWETLLSSFVLLRVHHTAYVHRQDTLLGRTTAASPPRP